MKLPLVADPTDTDHVWHDEPIGPPLLALIDARRLLQIASLRAYRTARECRARAAR